MNFLKRLPNSSLPWFYIGIFLVLVLSFTLHFWGLSRFNILLFDEVYYAKFGNNYLTHTPFFDPHPPLGKYIIAIGIWLGNQMPFGKDTMNSLTGTELSTFSYRWLNALTGSFIPLIIGSIAYQLSHRRSYALIATLFATLDGLLLVESRYALINIYIVFFGLLGNLFLLLSLANQSVRRWLWLGLAGICFGASVSVKWNGLWFLFGAYLLWIVAWVIQWLQKNQTGNQSENISFKIQNPEMPLQKLTQLKLVHIILNLGIIPFAVYSLIWIPHLQLNNIGLWQIQQKILSYHQHLGGNDIHPYCSPWYTWLLMIRPLAYFYETARNTTEQVPAYPPLPNGFAKVIYDVHAMGNPLLWWLSTAAIILLFVVVGKLFLNTRDFLRNGTTSTNWIALYLVINYAANLLPWMPVNRCLFMYHYMSASVFAELGLAWVVDRWLQQERSHLKSSGILVIGLIILSFIFWLPLYLGLPISPEQFKMRMLLRSWV